MKKILLLFIISLLLQRSLCFSMDSKHEFHFTENKLKQSFLHFNKENLESLKLVLYHSEAHSVFVFYFKNGEVFLKKTPSSKKLYHLMSISEFKNIIRSHFLEVSHSYSFFSMTPEKLFLSLLWLSSSYHLLSSFPKQTLLRENFQVNQNKRLAEEKGEMINSYKNLSEISFYKEIFNNIEKISDRLYVLYMTDIYIKKEFFEEMKLEKFRNKFKRFLQNKKPSSLNTPLCYTLF